jgi:hypothetical protein
VLWLSKEALTGFIAPQRKKKQKNKMGYKGRNAAERSSELVEECMINCCPQAFSEKNKTSVQVVCPCGCNNIFEPITAAALVPFANKTSSIKGHSPF